MINKKDKVLPLSLALRAAVYGDGDQQRNLISVRAREG